MTTISVVGRFFTAILMAALLAFAPLVVGGGALASGGAQLLEFELPSNDDTGITDNMATSGTNDDTMDMLPDDPMPIGNMGGAATDDGQSGDDVSSRPMDEASMSDDEMADDDEGGFSVAAIAALAIVVAGIAYLLFRRPTA